MHVYLNNEYVKRKDARISAFDRGFLFGEGLFETLRVYNHKPFKLSLHYERLKDSAKQLKIPFDLELSSLRAVIIHLLKLNGLTNAYARITVSSGDRDAVTKPTVLVEVSDKFPYKYEKYQSEGMTVVIYPQKRSPYSLVYKHKTTSYLENQLARRFAYKHQSQESIFINHKYEVTEGSASNIFIVKVRSGMAQHTLGRIVSSNRVVYTPPVTSGILTGITRQLVVGFCTKLGIKAREKVLKIKTLLDADEIFLTNSLMGIMPVVKIVYNDRIIKIGDATPGPLTMKLMEEYQEATGLPISNKTS